MHCDISSSVFWTQRRNDSHADRARRRSARGAEVSLPSASQGNAPSEVLTGANFSGLSLPSAGRLKEKLEDSRTEERKEALNQTMELVVCSPAASSPLPTSPDSVASRSAGPIRESPVSVF